MAHTFMRRGVQIGLVGTMLVLLCFGCRQGKPAEQITMEPTPLQVDSPLALPTQPLPTLPASPSLAQPEKTLGYSLDKHRLQTAMEAFGVAQDVALAWQQDALWYGVMPSTSLERTLALPMAQPGWVFRFGAMDSKREYIVHVVEGEVAGSMELRIPEYVEAPLTDLNPLDIGRQEILDSANLLEEYTSQESNVLTRFPNMDLDYRLLHPKRCEHPLWMLFDAKHLAEPLFIMDAMTGETVADPSCGEPRE